MANKIKNKIDEGFSKYLEKLGVEDTFKEKDLNESEISYDDLKDTVSDALESIVYKYMQETGTVVSKEDFDKAIMWFQKTFWSDPEAAFESLKASKRKSMKEAAPKKASTDHKWGDKSVKSQLALPENQKKLNDMMKSGRNWKNMKSDFINLINELDCTDKNKKQTIMKINGIKSEGAFYSTVGTYLTGIKTESLARNKSLDEAVPKDLMSRIKDTDGYSLRGRSGYDWEKQERTYPYDLDYANADSQEITAQDVMRMKRRGEDLSDIWVLVAGPKMWSGAEGRDQLVRLDKLGNPDLDFSTDNPRANQALKTTLNKAKKIYKGDIRNVSDSQPEKWTDRMSDPDRRAANAELGHKRPRWNDPKDFHRNTERHNQEIAKAKRDYKNGDISRKEMEQRIASAKELRFSPWDARALNDFKRFRANARYYDSNKTNKLGDLKDAKRELEYAQDRLETNKADLERAKAGSGSETNYVNAKIQELKKKMASLQAELDRYEQRLADNPQQKDIDDAQRGIDNATANIARNQEIINTLLRRNK